MRICHLGPTYLPIPHDHGGALERRVVEMAAAQAELGHDVTIFSRGTVDRVDFHRGCRVESRRAHLGGVPRNYEFLRHARRWTRHHRPHIVHLHGIPDGALAFEGLGVPTALTVDYHRFWLSGNRLTRPVAHRYLSRCLRQFDVILPDSRASASLFSHEWGRFDNVSVVPEGVNLGQFHPDEEAAGRARRTWDLTGPIVLYVGRVCEQKGTNILLDAWEQHLSRKGTLVLAGPIGHFGNDREDSDLAARISRMDVRHLGAVPEGKLAGLYNACDVFVMPTTRAEMFGMAALEAQACGKPVVASRCGGLPDTIAPDGGILFEPGHSDELAGAIDLLLRDAPTRTCMGAAAARHAEAFSWTTIGERLDVIYHAICKSR